MPLALNGPDVLDEGGIKQVLNLGASKATNYVAPVSVYLQRVLRPSTRDVAIGDEEYERAFDTFEALLAMRFIVEGGPGLPTGSYNYRGKRSFGLPGVPERLQAEIERDGVGWGPVAGGVFDDLAQAEAALDALRARLGSSVWQSFS